MNSKEGNHMRKLSVLLVMLVLVGCAPAVQKPVSYDGIIAELTTKITMQELSIATLTADNAQMRSEIAALTAKIEQIAAINTNQPEPQASAAANVPAGDQYADKTDGYYLVGSEIAPGTWRTETGLENCAYRITDAKGDLLDINYGMSGGTFIVSPGAYQVQVEGCGTIKFLQ